MTPVATETTFSLDDKYLLEEGQIILSGIQALVRLPLAQHRSDKRQGLHTGTLISGYRGSPLGGLDTALQRGGKILKDHHVVFIPGVNEDLGATAIFGSQIANLMPQPHYDGVLGMWYGKGPGVDRTGDIFRHANIAGVGRYGGVLALAGDDPTAKSSTIPSASEVALFDAQMPTLYPGNAQEILDLGLLGFALSRYCGSWVGFKIITNVADEFSTAEVSPDRIKITFPDYVYHDQPWQHTQNPDLIAPHSLNQEREIHEGRLEAAKQFAAVNAINRITINPSEAWLGIVAAGKTYYDVREALYQLGLNETALQRYGIRILKLGLLYPLETRFVRQFAQGLEEILVIEEKRAFIEVFLRDALYDLAERPRIVGKKDEQGSFLIRGDSELDADQIVAILVKRLGQRIPPENIKARLSLVKQAQSPLTIPLTNGHNNRNGNGKSHTNGVATPMLATRTAYFCSGCPHNRSTTALEDSIVGGGIGCHSLAIFMEGRNITGLTQMGGEGAQWVGAAPFSGVPHIFQNIGDGTLFHSGSLAIRQAVAAGTNVTYKILHNGVVAMTGGQPADGEMPIPELTQALKAEGVKRIIVVSHDPDKYPSQTQWAKDTELWERDRLDEAQRVLREISGVTVIIYDQPCAADLRRKRKRGQAFDPQTRIFINEAVCEGCGDCGVKSNCLSVFPIETEFGRKTQIHQSSCNKDYTCLQGDCPAFLTIIPAETTVKPKEKSRYRVMRDLPEPTRKVPTSCNLYLMGIGGTGVVTANQVLGTAAMLEGKQVLSLDQTGLSQKGGPVVSNLKIVDPRMEGAHTDVSNKIAIAEADAYIVFDILNGTTEVNLSRATPTRTIAAVSISKLPTGGMVSSPKVQFPESSYLHTMINARTKAEDNVYLDAIYLAEILFGSYMSANLITLGAAYQAGTIPLSQEAIDQAITLNGVAVEQNIQAFRVGRLAVVDPNWVASLQTEREDTLSLPTQPNPVVQTMLQQAGLGQSSDELRRLLEIRLNELIAYQNQAYAQSYLDFVQQVYQAEQMQRPSQTDLSEVVTRYLFKLMAYKDEYEVARLYLKPKFREHLAEKFGSEAKIAYQLHPPLLRALGLDKKLSLGPWFNPAFRLLYQLRWLRGTPLDIFGYTAMRRTERELIKEYRVLIEEALTDLTPQTYASAVHLAALPDMIRGYEDVKMENVVRYRAEIKKMKDEVVDEDLIPVAA